MDYHVMMLIYLLTSENVFLIETSNFRALLRKLYYFSAEFNKPRFDNIPELDDFHLLKGIWPERAIVFTRVLESGPA